MISPARNPRIMVFDSGVGGLSIVREIQQTLPGCDLIYASDNAAFPYGTKSEAELVERVDRVLHRLLRERNADIIIIACNTASTLTLPHLRERFPQPIVGVVPAIKPAAALSRSRVIGLLATPATVARPYTLELVQEFASDCTIISLGSTELVYLAEAKLRGQNPSVSELEPIGRVFRDHPKGLEMDTLVLPCTHFPLLREELSHVVGPQVTLIDSGVAIARRVAYWLQSMAYEPGQEPVHHTSLFTRQTAELDLLRPALASFDIHQLDIVDV